MSYGFSCTSIYSEFRSDRLYRIVNVFRKHSMNFKIGFPDFSFSFFCLIVAFYLTVGIYLPPFINYVTQKGIGVTGRGGGTVALRHVTYLCEIEKAFKNRKLTNSFRIGLNFVRTEATRRTYQTVE